MDWAGATGFVSALVALASLGLNFYLFRKSRLDPHEAHLYERQVDIVLKFIRKLVEVRFDVEQLVYAPAEYWHGTDHEKAVAEKKEHIFRIVTGLYSNRVILPEQVFALGIETCRAYYKALRMTEKDVTSADGKSSADHARDGSNLLQHLNETVRKHIGVDPLSSHRTELMTKVFGDVEDGIPTVMDFEERESYLSSINEP